VTTQVELYHITMGDNDWYFTSADTQQTYSGDTYVPAAVGRSGFEQKNELSKANIEVRVPLDNELAILLLSSFSEEIVRLDVFTKRDSTVEITWKGRLASLRPGDANLTLVFESVFTSLRRPGLRARFQKSCRHALYGRGCNLDPEDFATVGSCTALAGNVLTVTEAAAQGNGYYSGGMARGPDGSLGWIISHTGEELTMQRVPYSIQQAAADGFPFDVTIYPGCAHTRAVCIAKFDNLLNYGGFDWIPSKNPMGGSSIV